MEKLFNESILASTYDAIPEYSKRILRKLYLVILCLYVGSFQMNYIIWNTDYNIFMKDIWSYTNTTMVWLAGLYIGLALIMWRTKWYTVLPSFAVVLGLLYFAPGLDYDLLRKVMAVFLAIAAYGQKYRNIAKAYMWTVLGFILFAAAGVPLGLTVNREMKLGSEVGSAFGYIYANNWAHAVLQVLLLVWYLYLQKKHLITFCMFWLSIIPTFIWANCETVAIVVVIWPFISLAIDYLGRREKTGRGKKIWDGLMIAVPFLCLAFVLICALFTEQFYYLMKHVKHFGTISYRFVANGVAFKHFGIKLLGQPLVMAEPVVEQFAEGTFKLDIMDSAIATYLIEYGAIWMFAVLAWLTAANRKCVREKDHALLAISHFMVLFAIIERSGLKGPYNFVLMYPLATVGAMKVKEKLTSTTEASGSPENADVADVVPIPDSIESDQSSYNSIL